MLSGVWCFGFVGFVLCRFLMIAGTSPYHCCSFVMKNTENIIVQERVVSFEYTYILRCRVTCEKLD